MPLSENPVDRPLRRSLMLFTYVAVGLFFDHALIAELVAHLPASLRGNLPTFQRLNRRARALPGLRSIATVFADGRVAHKKSEVHTAHLGAPLRRNL